MPCAASPHPPRPSGHPTRPAPPTARVSQTPLEGETQPKVKPLAPSASPQKPGDGGARGRTPSWAGVRERLHCVPAAPRREAGSIQTAALRAGLAGRGERGERRAWGQPHPPGRDSQGSRNQGRKETREKENKFKIKGSPVRSGYYLSRLPPRQVARGTAPHGGEVSQRDGPALAPALLSSRRRVGPGGSHPPRDPTPPRTSPDFLSLPPPPLPTLHTPPRA